MQEMTLLKKIPLVLLCLVGLSITSCEKLDEQIPGRTMETIPAAFGQIVGVTADPSLPYGAMLWFEQPDKTIVVVRVNTSRGTIYETTHSYPRK